MKPATDQELRDTLRQMLLDWNRATPEQRADALRWSGKLAANAEKRILAKTISC